MAKEIVNWFSNICASAILVEDCQHYC